MCLKKYKKLTDHVVDIDLLNSTNSKRHLNIWPHNILKKIVTYKQTNKMRNKNKDQILKKFPYTYSGKEPSTNQYCPAVLVHDIINYT